MLSLKTIVTSLQAPLVSLNLAGLGVAALWLVSEGQKQVIWLGFMMMFFSPFIIPILLIPAGVFSQYMSLYGSEGRKGREKLMFLLSLGYIILFLTCWCIGIFGYVTQSVAPHAIMAGMLWANTAALVPLLWWSGRDRDNFFIMMMVEAAQAATIMLSVSRLLRGDIPVWASFGLFGGFLIFVAIMQSVYEKRFIGKGAGDPH